MRKQIIIALVNVAIISGIALAIIQFLDQSHEAQSFNFSIWALVLVVPFQICLIFCSAGAWKYLFAACTQGKMSWKCSLEQFGFMVSGKYIPGKIWGITMRGLTCDRHGLQTSEVVTASVFEQLLTLYIAGFLGGAIYLVFVDFWIGVTLFLMSALFGKHLINGIIRAGSTISTRIATYCNKNNLHGNFSELTYSSSLFLLGTYLSVWLVTLANFWLLLFLCGYQLDLNEMLPFIGAYMVSVGVGFIALFSPGGLVVREAVFVAMVAPFIDSKLALEIAMVFRIWNISFDVIAAFVGLLIFGTD